MTSFKVGTKVVNEWHVHGPRAGTVTFVDGVFARPHLPVTHVCIRYDDAAPGERDHHAHVRALRVVE